MPKHSHTSSSAAPDIALKCLRRRRHDIVEILKLDIGALVFKNQDGLLVVGVEIVVDSGPSSTVILIITAPSRRRRCCCFNKIKKRSEIQFNTIGFRQLPFTRYDDTALKNSV